MRKYVAIAITILGALLVLFSSLGITQQLSEADTVEAMLPPCTVEDGVPFVGEDEVTCYWGMSGEVLEIPAEAIAANVDVEISWTKSGVWIGIAEASEAEKCELKGDYYECQKESVNMIAGGPSSNGKITWQPVPGEYRFVAGGDDSQTLQQFDVDWNYEASLKSTLAISLLFVGLSLAATGAVFWYRTVKN
ncbi:MAG: hypothetical protein QF588_03045 [Candidatus Poseidoniaceae archaeon]|nr:hypothetical protein [Candidatus Poseidoniaceae archaeon]